MKNFLKRIKKKNKLNTASMAALHELLVENETELGALTLPELSETERYNTVCYEYNILYVIKITAEYMLIINAISEENGAYIMQSRIIINIDDYQYLLKEKDMSTEDFSSLKMLDSFYEKTKIRFKHKTNINNNILCTYYGFFMKNRYGKIDMIPWIKIEKILFAKRYDYIEITLKELDENYSNTIYFIIETKGMQEKGRNIHKTFNKLWKRLNKHALRNKAWLDIIESFNINDFNRVTPNMLERKEKKEIVLSRKKA